MEACPLFESCPRSISDEDEGEDDGGWEDWIASANDDVVGEQLLCLFCDTIFPSSALVFQHCASEHAFDFFQLRKDYELDFYDCLRMINFIRSKVADNTCWRCGLVQGSSAALLKHLKTSNHVSRILQNEPFVKEEFDNKESRDDCDNTDRFPWRDDKFLTPFMKGDPLLYSFEEDVEDDGSVHKLVHVEDKMDFVQDNELPAEGDSQKLTSMQRDAALRESHADCIIDELETLAINCDLASTTEGAIPWRESSDLLINGSGFGNGHNAEAFVPDIGCSTSQTQDAAGESLHLLAKKKQKNNLKVSFAEVAKKERFSINQSYFGSYSAFGIHREMLSDKIRTETYQMAITRNPLLLKGAVVMDVGCGTGILSLFAAKAGAKKVLAVEGSKKMSSVAQQVAKANGYLSEPGENSSECKNERVIKVVQGMIEELDLQNLVEPPGVDVLVSEWMGYCLLFESMLNSVLFARDHWLKPGGAILPDTAEMYVAGFGRGGTSLPFWENVYGFDMQFIGQEVLEDAAVSTIVDAVESKDIVTDACLIQAFDLVTMKPENVDFTATFELKPFAGPWHESEEHTGEIIEKNSHTHSNGVVLQKTDGGIWCYGLVLWFDTGFTNRFCKENPVVLSTSPYSPKTHWSQTLLTFREPVCLSVSENITGYVPEADAVGTALSPAMLLKGRISIARSVRHRSIDISLESAAVGVSGIVRMWPVQMFDL